MIDEIRAILADHDLSTVTTEFDEDAVVEEAPPEAADPVEAAPLRPALPVGARYRGVSRPVKTPRRSLFGR